MVISTSEKDIKERLSVAYVTAVAAKAGCQVANFAIDKMSIDAIICPISGPKSSVYLQLKATTKSLVHNNQAKMELPLKNYDDLRDTTATIPHYLVVLQLPPEPEKWLHITPTELAIRGVAFYGNLYGLPGVTNTTARTVTMPQDQQFDASILTKMIVDAPNRIGTAV